MYSAYIKHFFLTQHRLSLFCEVVGASRYSYVNLNVLQKHIKILQGHDMLPCTRCYMKSGLPRSCLDAFFFWAGDGNCRQVQVDYNAISSSHVCSLTLRKKERKEAIKGAPNH